MLRNQKGFTLIEIIAVLVILGILAAVAIPKYMDLQKDARGKALDGAKSALISSATMEYSRGLMNGMYNTTSGPSDNSSVSVGDYQGGWSGGTSGNIITVTVSNGPGQWSDIGTGYTLTANFKLR